jgi:Holliday junction resolvase-like predicted endonuclease
VIEAVCKHLKKNGFRIVQKLSEMERGDDIIARSTDDVEVVIEAKGETSSKATASRHGRSFDGSQVIVHVSRALFRAAEYYSMGRVAGIAIPRNASHERRIAAILPALKRLEIEVFWVEPNGAVTSLGHWPHWRRWKKKNPQKAANRSSSARSR